MMAGLMFSFTAILFAIISLISFIKNPSLSGRGLAISGFLISTFVLVSFIFLLTA